MVTLKQLQSQKKKLILKRDKGIEKQDLEFKKVEIQREIKVLQRSPSTSKNIALTQRTGRGLKVLGKKLGGATIRQFKRIKEQQMRDEAAIRKAESMAKQKVGRVGKVKTTIRKKKLKTGQKLSKIKEGKGFDVFSNLDF